MVKSLIAFSLISLTVFATVLSVRLGVFKVVKMGRVELGQMHFVGKDHIGPYHKIVPMIQSVESWVREKDLGTCQLTFGEYLDDPNQVDEERLRSFGGCVVNAPIADLPAEFHQKTFGPGAFLKATFNGSPAIGPFKVYPRARQWFIDNNFVFKGPIVEIYQITGADQGVTEYFFPIPAPDIK